MIIATGASARWLNSPGEVNFKGRGISVCAVCDGFFYKNKTVMVIGGGNTAVYEALYLSKIAQKVILVHWQNKLVAESGLIKRLNEAANVEILFDTQVRAFVGDKKLYAAVIEHQGLEKEIAVDGVFEAVGQIPNTGIFKGQLDLDEKGFIVTDKHTMATSKAGVFACGDVQESVHRQAIVAACGGCLASLNVQKFLTQ